MKKYGLRVFSWRHDWSVCEHVEAGIPLQQLAITEGSCTSHFAVHEGRSPELGETSTTASEPTGEQSGLQCQKPFLYSRTITIVSDVSTRCLYVQFTPVLLWSFNWITKVPFFLFHHSLMMFYFYVINVCERTLVSMQKRKFRAAELERV